jgi:hypothetical protein
LLVAIAVMLLKPRSAGDALAAGTGHSAINQEQHPRDDSEDGQQEIAIG